MLGFELIDDVDVLGPDGARRIEQVKNEEGTLTDKNRGLWKALAHWASDAAKDPVALKRVTRLVFATTALVRPGTFAYLLSTETSVEERKKHLKSMGDSTDSDLRHWMAAVRNLPESVLPELLRRVCVVVEGDADALRADIAALLRHRTFRDEQVDAAIEQFEGWLMQRVLSAFVSNQGAQVTEAAVDEVMRNTREAMAVEPLRFRHGATLFDHGARDVYRQRQFVRQLEAIQVPVDEIEDAVVDYLRNKRELYDWARYQEVGDRDLDAFEGELYRRWQDRFRDVGKYRQGLGDALWGCRLYADAIQGGPHLRNIQPQSHVVRGSYHKMADEESCKRRRIGWHPKWKSLFPARDTEK